MESPTCKVELTIEIPPDAVARESEQITSQFARVARVPGFRPGRAPMSLVARRYRDEIRSELVQSLVPRYFEEKVRDEKLAVVGEPRFEGLEFEDGQPIRAKATFEVYPQFELGAYRELEAEEDSPEVTEEDVDKAVERLRQGAATFEVIEDRGAEPEDFAVVSYQGRDVANPAAEPIELKEGMVQIGGRTTVAEFSEHLRGARPGEVREFTVAYPVDFPKKSLAGHSISYRVEIQALKRKEVPPADDELAKTVSEYSTFEELRASLRRDLAKGKREHVERDTRAKLLERLVAGHTFPVPETLVESQLQRRLERVLSGLLAQGVDPREAEVDWRKVRDEMRPEAERDVRASLILQRIAEAEKIEVSEEEIDETIRSLASETRETPAALKTRLTRDGALARLKSDRLSQKVLDFVYRSAKVTHPLKASAPVEGENPATP